LFTKYLEQGPTCGGLHASVLADLVSVLGQVEMQLLLTGLWMKKFCAAAVNQIDHIEGIQVIKKIVQEVKDQRNANRFIMLCNRFLLGITLIKKRALSLDWVSHLRICFDTVQTSNYQCSSAKV